MLALNDWYLKNVKTLILSCKFLVIDKSGLNICGTAFLSFFFLLLIFKNSPEGPSGQMALTVDGSITMITHSFRGVRRKEIAFFVKVFSIQFSPISPVWLSLELLLSGD